MKKIHWLFLFFAFKMAAQEKMTVQIKPEIIYIEQGENNQFLNFDVLLKNNSSDTLTLSKLKIDIFASDGKLIHSRFLDSNGTAPSIQVIPNRTFAPSQSQLIFNPITEFSSKLPLEKIRYELTFSNSKDEDFVFSKNITAQKNTRKPNVFPLKGKVLVYDGHDFYAHHRRFDYEFAPIKQLGITANFMRYAYDFVLLDENGKSFTGADKEDNYYGYNKPVYSAGDGKVIYASDKHKDDKTFDVPGIASNPMELYGNCIAIQHADRSVSIYGHLHAQSLKVNVGEVVKAGQQIGAIGISGSSFFPHLHFEVRTGITNGSEGLPSYFSNLFTAQGTKEVRMPSGLPETGMVLQTK